MEKGQQKALEPSPVRGASSWLYSSRAELMTNPRPPLLQRQLNHFTWEMQTCRQSLWLVVRWPGEGGIMLRTAYSPDGELHIVLESEDEYNVSFRAESALGSYRICVRIIDPKLALFRLSVQIIPIGSLMMPYWPVDINPINEHWDPLATNGIVRAAQRGAGTGLVFLSLMEPPSGSMLYIQDFTTLNDYCELSHTDPKTCVGGSWPELGYTPPKSERVALPANRPVTMSDAFITFSTETPEQGPRGAELFMEMLACIYPHLERPDTSYQDWPKRAEETLDALEHADECSTTWDGRRYLNAYVGTGDWRPESMTLLSVVLPLLEYGDWLNTRIPFADELLKGLPIFFDRKIGCFLRYPHGAEKTPQEGKDARGPWEVDSWYLYGGLSNLARLAARGEKTAHKLLMNSVDYAVNTAHHFDYKWPIMFKADSLEVLNWGKTAIDASEPDVPGLYAYLMLQLSGLTNEPCFLEEAKKAADTLHGLDFSIGYQFNNTAWAAVALLHLYRETGNRDYFGLAHINLAAAMQNSVIWECNYGPASHYPTFFGVLPLQDAPYMAMFEEVEMYNAYREFLLLASKELTPAVRLLLAEYSKYALWRDWWYYPCELPQEILEEQSLSGHLNRELAIPLEDIYPGWSKAGKVGQQIYGAAAPFTYVTKAYYRRPQLPFIIYSEYPITDLQVDAEKQQATIHIGGDDVFTSRVRLLPDNGSQLPMVDVQVGDSRDPRPAGLMTPEGHREYIIKGDCRATIAWQSTPGSASRRASA